MVDVIEHEFLSDSKLSDIIEIKSVAWNYTYEQHNEWIKKNLESSDLHFLVYRENELIAYTNLIKISIINGLDNTVLDCLGLGNVCVKHSGQGDGKILMEHVSNYLLKNDYISMLFCKDTLVEFYRKFGWKNVETVYPNKNVNTMFFNMPNNCSIYEYSDRLF